jgi:hypothetical protein
MTSQQPLTIEVLLKFGDDSASSQPAERKDERPWSPENIARLDAVAGRAAARVKNTPGCPDSSILRKKSPEGIDDPVESIEEGALVEDSSRDSFLLRLESLEARLDVIQALLGHPTTIADDVEEAA